MDFEIEELCRIATRAGGKILEIYNDPSQNWEIETKADESPLTKADTAANAIICHMLSEMAPEIPIISEENRIVDLEVRKGWEWFWLVDPLDGTKEFIKRNGEFTVNIALIHRDKVHSGVVYVPVTDELFYSKEGNGAWHKRGNELSQLFIKPLNRNEKGLRIVCSRSHMNDETKVFVEQFDTPSLISAGSSLKFLLVAQGKADIYPRLGPTMEWDTAAAHAIVKEAGGKVNDAHTGEELTYNKTSLLNNFFVVE